METLILEKAVGFCERDALIMHVIEVMIRKTNLYFI